ncbi:toll/interleukin-1 receptor domain-containing protein [Lichenihabitans psoromatis]|uniref:toll/interleukin-1 receptor domain-containing protein n=1 Tax=Lichenihabitans psoromatis TaxID=2528642 RepID=UPI001FE11E19|nr:toll/interleukin-1 receptor domain-containing protein [Lichenihabitans psoromatis]
MADRKSGATGKSPTSLSTAPNGRNRPAGPTKSAASRPGVRIFVSYSHLDDASREKLAKHLAPLAREDVNIWFDGDIHAGDELDPEISRALRRAHLFVALISSNYLSSNYCWRKEYQRAMGRRTRGEIHVVGVVLKPCDWKSTKAARFKQLPRDGRAVTDWRSADHAYLDVTEGIRKVVKDIRKELVAQTAETAARSRARKAAAPSGRKATLKVGPGPKPPEASTKRPESRPKPTRGPARAPGSGKASPEVRRVRRPR